MLFSYRYFDLIMNSLRNLLMALMICFMPFLSNAQNFSTDNYTAEVNAAVGNISNISVQLRKNFYLGAKDRIVISPGIRIANAFAQSADYISAPFDITKEPARIDTFRVGETNIFSGSLYINLGYQITEKLSFNFDIDLFGISFGPEQTGTWIPGEASANAQNTPQAGLSASPTSLNALLVGDNDIGTLASGFTLNYRISEKVGIKAGLGYLFTEYTSDTELGVAVNDRWRAKTVQFAFGTSYNF